MGSVRKNPVKIKTDIGMPMAVYIRISEVAVFISPKFFISMNSGTMPSLTGIIMPSRKKKNSAGFQRNGYLAI
ncbi:hypothetical protein D3C86_2097990 [compost metagenome]